ncbi:DNA-binding MarR family transcriptional regulator [Sphingomonas jejuensis]|uniref:DNA-binding MarR family transcriptional regulator n=1 Tax=Sphingomonas jejuensis TaxID=904715 RepID=A0ABX0XGS7_9SPHN|nr:MarR family transcriptional regulator [Sphingomonas jejuensis]NJC32532.1 DNA-binding MarR family transcriptional regulator [Sphingomonas jejuensis]
MPQPLTLDTFLPYRLSFTSNLVSARIAAIYESLFGLSIPEWRLVAVLAEADGITQAAVGMRTRMDKVTVSRAALSLTARGLVAKSRHSDDGRARLLHLTAAGRALYDAVAPKALALEAEIFGSFSADDLAHFQAMLRRIDAAVLDLPVGDELPKPAAAD